MDIDPLLLDLPQTGSVLASPAAAAADFLTAADATSTRPGEAQVNISALLSGVPGAAVSPLAVRRSNEAKEKVYPKVPYGFCFLSSLFFRRCFCRWFSSYCCFKEARMSPQVTTTDSEPTPGAADGEVAGALLPAISKTPVALSRRPAQKSFNLKELPLGIMPPGTSLQPTTD